METQPGCNSSTMTVPPPQMSRKQSRMAMEISIEGKKEKDMSTKVRTLSSSTMKSPYWKQLSSAEAA